jgi:hypothetical protein
MNHTNFNSFSSPDDSMSLSSLPPLPKASERGPHVCVVIQLYLGIVDELSPTQRGIIHEHLHNCLNCAAVQGQVQYTNRLFADLPVSAPSARVDQAVMAAIAARSNGKTASSQHVQSDSLGNSSMARRTHFPNGGGTLMVALGVATLRKRWLVAATSLALVGALLFAVLATFHVMPNSATGTFLPANLSWSGYVLYHSETRHNSQGQRYRVDTYHNLSTDRIHIETMMLNILDVVVVGDKYAMLGLDMMHHIAQWGANDWKVDETPFNLAKLRSDISANRATYLDKDTFHGQDVYRVRCRDGLVLLLNMHYQPVNVLRGAVGPGTGEPVYDILQLMPASHISNSMWDMRIPAGFRMGTLPPQP